MENNERYYVIHCFFSEELNLSGIDKEVFALIYGFTRDGRNANGFWGTIDYMAKYIGVNEKSITRSLKYLTEQKLINKYSIRAESKFFRYAYEVNLNTVFEKRKHFKEAKNKLTDNLSPSVDDMLTDKMSFTIEGLTDNLSYKEGGANGQNVPLYYKENNNIENNNSIIDCEKQIFSPPLSSFSEKGTKIETPSETSEKTISLNTKKKNSLNSTRPDACLNTEKKAKEKKYADKHNLQKEFMEMYFEAHEKFKGIKPPQKDMGRIAKSLNELRLAIEEVVDRSYSEKCLLVDAELMKKKLGGFLLASYEKMDDFTKRQWDANYINSKFANIYAILVGAVPQKPTTKGFYQQSAPATFSELQDKQFQKDFLIAILKSINVIFYGSAVKGKTEGIRVGKETLTSNRQVIDKLNEDGFIVDNQFTQIIKQNLIDSNCEIDYNSTHIANFCSHYNIDIDSFKGGL